MKLDRVTSSSIVPQGGGEGHAGSAAGSVPGSRVGSQVEMRDLAKQGIKDHEEGVVSWQQKIFSQVRCGCGNSKIRYLLRDK